MTEISRSALFGRLNPTALKAIETATAFCKMRGNPYVEVAHWIHVLLQDPRNDVAAIRNAFGMDDTRLAQDVVAALDSLLDVFGRSGTYRAPDLGHVKNTDPSKRAYFYVARVAKNPDRQALR